MNKNDIAKRLLQARKTANMTQKEIAQKFGLTYQAISNYERGTTKVESAILVKLCEIYKEQIKAFGGDPALADMRYILTGETNTTNEALQVSTTPDEQVLIDKYRQCDTRGKEMVDNVLNYEYNRSTTPNLDNVAKSFIKVRVHYQAAAAGLSNYLTEEDGCEEIMFPSSEVPFGTDYGVRISGDSMKPTIPNGSIVFVKTKPAIESGQIGIFALNGDGYCKRLKVDHERGVIWLESDNEKYKRMRISADDELRTYGEVLGWAKL